MPKWKNRPGGKKGWRTIQEDPQLVQTKHKFTLKNTSRQRDEDLFYVDEVGNQERTKSAVRLSARADLEATGHLPRTDRASWKERKESKIHVKKQLLKVKQTRPMSKHGKNRRTMRKKREREDRFGNEHCFDPWADDDDEQPLKKKKKKTNHKKNAESADADELDESFSSSSSDECDESSNRPMADVFGGRFADDTPAELIESMKRSYGVIKVQHRPVKNRNVPRSIGIRRPTHGESVNPLPSDMIEVGLQRQRVIQQQKFKEEWGNRSVKNWFSDRVGKQAEEKPNPELKRLMELKKANSEFSKKWSTLLKSYQKKGSLKAGINQGCFTSDRLMDRTKRKFIYGKSRVNRVVPAKPISLQKVGRPLRLTTDASGSSVSNMMDEFRAQNRTEGRKKKSFVFQRKAFWGPRFKVQTRVGGVHHNNVGSRVFRDFEDLQY